jgi:hypothetical protein
MMPRIIAFAAGNVGNIKTVNVLAVAPADDAHRVKTYTQVTAAVAAAAAPGQIPTFMASGAAGAVTAGLPIIFINGYTAPN